MRRFILTLIFCAFATVASASGNRLRLIYIAPPSPFPATQTIHFGAKTLVGLGGSPMAYASPQNLGLSRWLAITSQMDGSSGAVIIFQIDDRNMLVPKNGAGAYGTAWTTPAAGPYTVVVAEYTDAAHTLPTGNSTTITIPIDAATAHVREMTQAARGCAVNCETTNPDGGAGAFSATTNQFNKTLSTGTTIVLGDTLTARDGYFNPTNLGYRIRPPAAGYTGSGRITIISETIDNSTDANGNPRLQNGFKFGGGMIIDSTLSGDVLIPYDFTHLWCYVNYATAANGCVAYSTLGNGVGVSYTRFETGPLTVSVNIQGITMRGPSTSDHNHFVAMGKSMTSNTDATITNNICENSTNDFITMAGINNTVNDNFCFNWKGVSPNHVDNIQSLGIQSGGSQPFGTELRNIFILNDVGTPTASPQCLFNDDTTSPNRLTGAILKNNICNLVAANITLFTYFDGPNASLNTGLSVINPGVAVSNATLSTTVGKGGTNGTFNNNVYNAYNVTSQGGTVTTTNNITLARTNTAYVAAFPNYVQGSNPGWKTRAAVIQGFTPANLAAASGGVVNVDGTVSGALFPANDFGEVCWNDGSVWDHTAHCTAAQ